MYKEDIFHFSCIYENLCIQKKKKRNAERTHPGYTYENQGALIHIYIYINDLQYFKQFSNQIHFNEI